MPQTMFEGLLIPDPTSLPTSLGARQEKECSRVLRSGECETLACTQCIFFYNHLPAYIRWKEQT